MKNNKWGSTREVYKQRTRELYIKSLNTKPKALYKLKPSSIVARSFNLRDLRTTISDLRGTKEKGWSNERDQELYSNSTMFPDCASLGMLHRKATMQKVAKGWFWIPSSDLSTKRYDRESRSIEVDFLLYKTYVSTASVGGNVFQPHSATATPPSPWLSLSCIWAHFGFFTMTPMLELWLSEEPSGDKQTALILLCVCAR